jgi:hypothetical protein
MMDPSQMGTPGGGPPGPLGPDAATLAALFKGKKKHGSKKGKKRSRK